MSRRLSFSRFASLAGVGLLLAAAGCGDRKPQAARPAPGAPAAAKPAKPTLFTTVVAAKTATGLVAPMQLATLAGAAEGQGLKVELGAGKPPQVQGSAQLQATLPAAGEVYVWCRCYWLGECSNSLTLRLPGKAPLSVGQDSTYNAWHWCRATGPVLELPAGPVTFTVEQREDGIALDQLLITNDPDYVPMGVEKP